MLQSPALRAAVTVSPLPVEVEVVAGTKLRGHEWLVVGPPVVFVHDEGGDLDNWGNALQMCADAGFHVIAVDLRGHGLSDGAADRAALAGDLAGLVRHVQRVWGTCGLVVAGLSCRGTLGLGSEAGAPVQVLVTPTMPDLAAGEIRRSTPAIRMVISASLDQPAKEEAQRVFDSLPGQKVMASVGDDKFGERLLQERTHLVEDVCMFFRMYLSPFHPRTGTRSVPTGTGTPAHDSPAHDAPTHVSGAAAAPPPSSGGK